MPNLFDFEKRMGKNAPFIKNPDSTISTHKMAWGSDDKGYYAFPTIINRNGKLEELSPKDANAYAHQTGELKRFNTQAEAEAYAAGSWKDTKKDTKMANMFDFLKSATKVHRGFVEGANPQFAQAQASQRQAKQQELKNDIERIKTAGGPTTEAGRQMLSELSGKYPPEMFMEQPTELDTERTRATSGLADIREQELAEKGKPDLWKFLNEVQDIQAKYRKEELTEDAARAGMSLLAQKSPELSKLSGIFDLPEREKELLTLEEQREEALIKGKLKPGAQPPEKPTQKIEYWKNGQRHSELVKASRYTPRIKEIQDAGGTLETPKTRQEQKKIQLELDTMSAKLEQLKDKPMAQYVKYYLDLSRNAIATFDLKAGKDYNRIAAQLIETIEVPKVNVIDPQGKEWIIDVKEWPEAQKRGWKKK